MSPHEMVARKLAVPCALVAESNVPAKCPAPGASLPGDESQISTPGPDGSVNCPFTIGEVGEPIQDLTSALETLQ